MLINRVTVPIIYLKGQDVTVKQTTDVGAEELRISTDFDRETGLGDIVLWSASATNDWVRPPNVFDFGPTVMLDTATDDVLGM